MFRSEEQDFPTKMSELKTSLWPGTDYVHPCNLLFTTSFSILKMCYMWHFSKFSGLKTTVMSWHAILNLSSNTHITLKCLAKFQNDIKIILKMHSHGKHCILLLEDSGHCRNNKESNVKHFAQPRETRTKSLPRLKLFSPHHASDSVEHELRTSGFTPKTSHGHVWGIWRPWRPQKWRLWRKPGYEDHRKQWGQALRGDFQATQDGPQHSL